MDQLGPFIGSVLGPLAVGILMICVPFLKVGSKAWEWYTLEAEQKERGAKMAIGQFRLFELQDTITSVFIAGLALLAPWSIVNLVGGVFYVAMTMHQGKQKSEMLERLFGSDAPVRWRTTLDDFFQDIVYLSLMVIGSYLTMNALSGIDSSSGLLAYIAESGATLESAGTIPDDLRARGINSFYGLVVFASAIYALGKFSWEAIKQDGFDSGVFYGLVAVIATVAVYFVTLGVWWVAVLAYAVFWAVWVAYTGENVAFKRDKLLVCAVETLMVFAPLYLVATQVVLNVSASYFWSKMLEAVQRFFQWLLTLI